MCALTLVTVTHGHRSNTNPIKLDVFRCVPCYIPSNDPEYLL